MEEQKLLKKRKKAFLENHESHLVTICTDLANLYTEKNYFKKAIEEYELVAKIHKKHNKQLEYAIVNRAIGEAYLGLNMFGKALEYQKIYLDIARQVQNKVEEQRALATLGHTYLTSYLENPESDQKNLNLANKYFKSSLVVSQSLNGEIGKTEMADMLARLFSNLGVVQDCFGNYQEALNLITKSINLCRENDLYEQLQRGYNSLASILIKMKDYKGALQQYNLAVEAAKKIKDKPILLAVLLLSKSEVLIKLSDFKGAKSALLKAYRLKISDEKEKRTIESNLRVVASMCLNEDKLLKTDNCDYKNLKYLYEKLGDGSCELRQYEKAIEYYKKMLELAEKAEMSDLEISTCYYSLAETFKDNNQFSEALEYFEKEFQLCTNLKDQLNTISKIIDTTEEAPNTTKQDIEVLYNRAFELCQNENNKHEEGRMLKRFIIYLRRIKQHSEAFKWEKKLIDLDYQSSESETESEVNNAVVGSEINLDELTDVSDDSDREQPLGRRRRTKNFQIKRNERGETPLHTACIKGQMNVVTHLLDQGHPINVRDNCGWLPLHEACLHGHYEIVELLLEKGGAINDRGGIGCEGITPLHDAASNGHLRILQLLLKKGANPLAKTDSGESVLDHLKKWKTKKLDDEQERLYSEIVEFISASLTKAGHTIQPINETNSCSALILDEENPPLDGTQRRSTLIGLDDLEAPNEYKSTIDNLRHRNTKPTQKKLSVIKRSALVPENEIVDDWLEDDLSPKMKKRKTNSPIKLNETQKKQTKLTNLGHTRVIAEPDSTSNFPRTKSFEQVIEPTLSVDVRIDKKLYRVPILLSQVGNYTIKWLADEAATRYAKKEYMQPTLQLETSNGAILADNDPLNLLFPLGSTQSEIIQGRILKWNVLPLINRFREACQDMSIDPNETICRILDETSINLNLSNLGLIGGALSPLCKVLNHQTNLLELDLSGNFLNTECFQFLGASMPSLENLNKLNLSCTGLKCDELQLLLANYSPDGASIPKLHDIDLSDNLLADESFEILTNLTKRFHLKRLNLAGNQFTNRIFQIGFNNEMKWMLDQVEELNLSDNFFGSHALIRILSWLKFENLKSLNVSRNSVKAGFLKEVLSNWENGKLRICKLSRCCVNDSEVIELLRVTNSLEVLDLSYNDDLTSISLRRLLESKISKIDLYGCKNILRYFTDFSRYCDTTQQIQSLKLSLPVNCDTEQNSLINLWQNFYGDKAIIELNYNFLSLSVNQTL